MLLGGRGDWWSCLAIVSRRIRVVRMRMRLLVGCVVHGDDVFVLDCKVCGYG
jgi:hypothetical protein